MVKKFSEKIKSFDFAAVGKSIINGIKDGIVQAWDTIVQWVMGALGGLWDSIKGFFSGKDPITGTDSKASASSTAAKKTATASNSKAGTIVDEVIATGQTSSAISDWTKATQGNDIAKKMQDLDNQMTSKSTSVSVTQNIYAKAQTPSELAKETRYYQQEAFVT